MDVSEHVRGLPAGTPATMRGTELTIGGMHVDLRTLFHACGALDSLKTHTFPADHAQYPRWSVPLASRHGSYVNLVKHANGSYTAFHGKVPLSTHPTAGDAAVARAVYLGTAKKRRREAEDDEFLAARPAETVPGASEAATSGAAAEEDVSFVKERTREERDAEGRANAVVIDA